MFAAGLLARADAVADARCEQARPPSLRIGLLGSLTVNGQAGALVPAQSQLILALALNRGGLSNRQLRRLLGADAGHPKPADSLRQLIARTGARLAGLPGAGRICTWAWPLLYIRDGWTGAFSRR
jgi:hypothetical protein